jgi:predicted CoA-binding protein
MRAMNYSDEFLRTLLNDVKTVAVVGISANPVRPSYFVARYLGLKGYRVIPINPGLAGQELFGEVVYPDLASVPDEVNMVDIFRRSEAVPSIVEEALEKWPNLKAVWMQIGVESAEGRAMAEARGVRVVENRCPKIEYQRLFGELRMGGFNTGIISSKL